LVIHLPFKEIAGYGSITFTNQIPQQQLQSHCKDKANKKNNLFLSCFYHLSIQNTSLHGYDKNIDTVKERHFLFMRCRR